MGNFKMSPMTAAWLSYMRGNPGGQYPDILKDFQWGVSNRCQAVENVDRQLIFVQGNRKNFENSDILQDLSFKVYDHF